MKKKQKTITFSQAHDYSEQLKDFLTALENADPDLRWIETTVSKLRTRQVKQIKRDAFSSPFNTKNNNVHFILDTGDDWYDKLRKKECEVGKCCSFVPSYVEINNPESNSEENTLYDEAEYQPLSKFEQDPNWKLKKEKTRPNPRSLDPAKEVKLRISTKMQNRGLSAALPSDMYSDEPHKQTIRMQVDDIKEPESQRSEEPIPNLNVFKRDPNISQMDLIRTKRTDHATNEKELIKKPENPAKNETNPEELVREIKILNMKLTNSEEFDDDQEAIRFERDLKYA